MDKDPNHCLVHEFTQPVVSVSLGGAIVLWIKNICIVIVQYIFPNLAADPELLRKAVQKGLKVLPRRVFCIKKWKVDQSGKSFFV